MKCDMCGQPNADIDVKTLDCKLCIRCNDKMLEIIKKATEEDAKD